MNVFLERFGLTNSLCAVQAFSSNLFLVFYTTGPSDMEKKKNSNNSSSALNQCFILYHLVSRISRQSWFTTSSRASFQLQDYRKSLLADDLT